MDRGPDGSRPTWQDRSAPAADAKRIFLLLRQLGLEYEQAYTLVRELPNMAANNLIARFESKLDSTRWLLAVLVAIFGTTMLGLVAGIFYLILGK